MATAIPRPAGDPDAFDPATFDAERFAAGREAAAAAPPPLDPRLDPDRFAPESPTLPALLRPTDADPPVSTWTWVIGLVAVFGFLALVSLAFSTVFQP